MGPGSVELPRRSLKDEDQVSARLQGLDDLDFNGWNNADWNGVLAHHHSHDVLMDWKA